MRLFTNLAKKPALIFGPGEIQLAHFTDEHVKVSDVVKACKSYAMLVLQRVGA